MKVMENDHIWVRNEKAGYIGIYMCSKKNKLVAA